MRNQDKKHFSILSLCSVSAFMTEQTEHSEQTVLVKCKKLSPLCPSLSRAKRWRGGQCGHNTSRDNEDGFGGGQEPSVC